MSRPPALLAAALVAALGCHEKKDDDVLTTAPMAVVVAPARVATVSAVVAATGTVQPAPDADLTVTSPQPARVVALPFAVGDHVRRGQVVARFDAPALRSDLATRAGALAQAQARLANARQNHERLSRLLERGIASRKETEDALRELQQAEAAVREGSATQAAAAELAARAIVPAPFEAVVAERWHGPGDLVDAGEHVLRLVNPARLQVMAAVAAADVPRIAAGRPARVRLPGATAQTAVAATVISGAGTVDASTGTAPVRLSLDGTLPAGTPVELEIMAEVRKGVLAVPSPALVKEGEDTFVYVVGPDRRAHRRPVGVGLQGGGDVEVLSGLQAGETVVVRGQRELPDGAQVSVEEAGAGKPPQP